MRTPYPHGGVIHEIFRNLARVRPEAVALVEDDRQITYRELDRASDVLARRLQDSGVSPRDLVPVMMPRSAGFVAVLLALLKCGAAYAALDGRWPREQLAAVVRQLRPPLIVSGGAAGWGPPSWQPGPLEEAIGGSGLPYPVEVDGGDPATVFFTSGTTGRPKGVITPHRATARLAGDPMLALGGPGTAMPQAAPVPWDGYSLELWGMLLTGGTSVVVAAPYLMPQELRALVAGRGVDRVWLTASLFNLFVEEDVGAFGGLRQVVTGGERLSPHHVRAFMVAHPGVRLINGYGPVESTVFTTAHLVRPQDCRLPEGVPIGRAVLGTEVFVLDGERLCGPGETGEICVGGDGLAVEYLGDPQLTAERFPAWGGRRVYRSGDLGHVDADGLLHFAGRGDRQVKLRGHRIELAAIEAVATAQPEVSRCLAVVEAARLHLFFVASDLSAEELGVRLRESLPAYAAPEVIHRVDAFPMTANGKIDKAALLALAAPARRQAAGAPADALTLAVAAAFAEVIGVPELPHDVSLFELGGNSLDAGRICVRLRRRLDRPVPISRLMIHPTVNGLAAWLKTTRPSPPP
ncbi:non-ribosomal peptide synthetase, partial [Nonomuraea sp. KM90]|uniref:non-ribosomal peptide synthetase n=1 Tax=Nonomuraea sp. KM90 TaxID=3457428 RepID=UPI003FCC2D9E